MNEDPIDALLRTQSIYIEDADFTEKVVARLPAYSPRHDWLRPALLLGTTAIGYAVTTHFLPSPSLIAFDFASLDRLPATMLLPGILLISATISVAWGAVSAMTGEE